MKVLGGALIALLYQAQLILAAGDHGIAERIFAYEGYVAEGLQDVNPKTIATGCVGTDVNKRCNFDEFVKHIDENPSQIRSSKFFAAIGQNNLYQFKFAQLIQTYYTEYKKGGGTVPRGFINAGRLVPGKSWYGDAVQHIGGVLSDAKDVTLSDRPTQARLSSTLNTAKEALQFACDKRLAQMDDPGIGGGRVSYFKENPGAPRSSPKVGGDLIKTKPGTNPFIGAYTVLDVQATKAAFKEAGLGDFADTDGRPYSEFQWHMYNYENSAQSAKNHVTMLTAMTRAAIRIDCKAPS